MRCLLFILFPLLHHQRPYIHTHSLALSLTRSIHHGLTSFFSSLQQSRTRSSPNPHTTRAQPSSKSPSRVVPRPANVSAPLPYYSSWLPPPTPVNAPVSGRSGMSLGPSTCTSTTLSFARQSSSSISEAQARSDKPCQTSNNSSTAYMSGNHLSLSAMDPRKQTSAPKAQHAHRQCRPTKIPSVRTKVVCKNPLVELDYCT